MKIANYCMKLSFVVFGVTDKENMVKLLIEHDPGMVGAKSGYKKTPFTYALEGNSE